MSPLLALVGGDEFRPGCESMDRALIEAARSATPSLIVVPTAAAAQRPDMAAAQGVEYFSRLGVRASALMVLDGAHAADPDLLAPMGDADIIYFTGGSPAHLLEVLCGSLLLKQLQQALEAGVLVAGSSAGAMVLGSWMRYRDWTTGLGVVPGLAVLPHHERGDANDVASELARSAPPDLSVLGIDAGSGCLGRDGAWEVVGQGAVTLYRDGKWQRFTAPDAVPL